MFLRSWKAFLLFYYLCSRDFIFTPDFPVKNSKFSKTINAISITFCTVMLHPMVLLRAQRHQSLKTGMLETYQNYPEIDQKGAIFALFSIFLRTVHTSRTKSSTAFQQHIRVPFVQWHQNRAAGI